MKRLLAGCVLALVAAVASVALLASPAAADAPEYVITDLGAAWNDHSSARAINARGEIVGEKGIMATAAYWDESGYSALPALASEVASLAYDINDRGQAVGYSVVYTGPFISYAVLWEEDTITALDADYIAYAINDHGQVVGYGGAGSAVMWDNGEVIDLGTGWAPVDINNGGQVVGNRGTTAVLWHRGVITDLGSFTAKAINDVGQVVGFIPPSGNSVLWEKGVTTDLGSSFLALGINNRGQIVGQTHGSGDWEAVLWQKGDLIELPDLGGSVASATAINDRGQIVGGCYYQSTGLVHATTWQRTP